MNILFGLLKRRYMSPQELWRGGSSHISVWKFQKQNVPHYLLGATPCNWNCLIYIIMVHLIHMSCLLSAQGIMLWVSMWILITLAARVLWVRVLHANILTHHKNHLYKSLHNQQYYKSFFIFLFYRANPSSDRIMVY